MRRTALPAIFIIVLLTGPICRLTIAGWMFMLGLLSIIVFGLIHLLLHTTFLLYSSSLKKNNIILVFVSHALYLCLFMFQSDFGDDKGAVVIENLFGSFLGPDFAANSGIILFTTFGLYLLVAFILLYHLKKEDRINSKKFKIIVISIVLILVLPIGLLYLSSDITERKAEKKEERLGRYQDLSRALKNKEKVIYLRLYEHPDPYTEIPEKVFQLYNLEELEMYSNEIKEIPASINALQNLRKLDLQYNQIKKIPDELYTLPKLETLVLMNNQVDSISPRICECTSLKEIKISGHGLRSLPPCMAKMPRLEKLVVQSDSINSFMEEFAAFKTLKELTLFSYGNATRDHSQYEWLKQQLPNVRIY